MRNLLPVCAGLLVISGIVSVNLWRELRADRQLIAELRAQVAQSNNADRRPMLPTQRTIESPPPVASIAKTSGDGPIAPPVKVGQSGQPLLPIQNLVNLESDLMKDPEYRKARLAQTRLNIPRNYPGLAEELGLSEKEADQVFDLLAEQQLNTNLILPPNATPEEQRALLDEMRRTTQASQRKLDEALSGMLGGTKYAQWQDYQQTRGARTQAAQLGTTLASAGMPMSDAQMRPLTAALITEQKRQRDDMQTLMRDIGPADAQNQARLQEMFLKRQEESNRRILEAAAPHLNAQQLAALRANFETQDAMRRASNRIQQARDAAQRSPGQPTTETHVIFSAQ